MMADAKSAKTGQTLKETKRIDSSQWVNKADYERVRESISKWPEWKREICNTSRPSYAKPF